MQDRQDEKCREIESAIETLLKDHYAAVSQRDFALAEVDRNRLDRQAKYLWSRIEELDQERKRVCKPDFVQLHREFQSQLPKIDFGALKKAIRKILDEHQDHGCAAMLLFQQSASMGGEWCAARVRELLSSETNPGCFSHIRIEFQPSERADILAPLRRLGGYLKLDPPTDDPEGFSWLVVRKLCGSLRSGSVIMIEFHSFDYFSDARGVLATMLDQFWRRLVGELASVAQQYYGVKIITLLFVSAALRPGAALGELCCTLRRFKSDKLLEIELTTWTRDDIRDWIAHFSGLNLPRVEVDLMADVVFGATKGGVPTLVERELVKRCVPVAIG